MGWFDYGFAAWIVKHWHRVSVIVIYVVFYKPIVGQHQIQQVPPRHYSKTRCWRFAYLKKKTEEKTLNVI